MSSVTLSLFGVTYEAVGGRLVAVHRVAGSGPDAAAYGEQCADTDGLAVLEARIARKDAANEALLQRVLAQDAKLEATMSDMRTLEASLRLAERSRAELMAEAQRLSGLLVKQEQELATLRPKPEPVPEHPVLRAIRRGR
jgi:hypothetical protein